VKAHLGGTPLGGDLQTDGDEAAKLLAARAARLGDSVEWQSFRRERNARISGDDRRYVVGQGHAQGLGALDGSMFLGRVHLEFHDFAGAFVRPSDLRS